MSSANNKMISMPMTRIKSPLSYLMQKPLGNHNTHVYVVRRSRLIKYLQDANERSLNCRKSLHNVPPMQISQRIAPFRAKRVCNAQVRLTVFSPINYLNYIRHIRSEPVRSQEETQWLSDKFAIKLNRLRITRSGVGQNRPTGVK